MSETYARLSPIFDAVGVLPRLFTLPAAATLYCLGRYLAASSRPYHAFFLLDAAFRISGGRMLPALFAQIANLVALGQLVDALELKRWADGAIERKTRFSAPARRHMRCYLNGLLPLHWHEIRQLPDEAVDPLSIDYRRVSAVVSVSMALNPDLVERFAPGMTVTFDADKVPVLRRPGPDHRIPEVVPLRYRSLHRTAGDSSASARAPGRWTK